MIDGLTINHIPTDMDFKDNTCDHKCSCCGACCTPFIPITKKELFILKDYIKKNNIKGSYLFNYDGKNLFVLCPLLDPVTNKCRVYPVRPFVCRNFKCDKNKETLDKERYMYAKRADYNAFILDSPLASLQLLLFDDYRFDIQYRHLLLVTACKDDSSLKLKVGELTLEKERMIMPMLVDEYIQKGGS